MFNNQNTIIMKRTIRTIAILTVLVALDATASAQQKNTQQSDRQQRITREQLAEVEARHIAGELAFSDIATEKFIAAYCSYRKEIWELVPHQRADKKWMSEQENEDRIKQRFAMSEQLLGIRQKYYKEYSKFLTQTQISKVYEQERKLMNRHAKKGFKKQVNKKQVNKKRNS